MAGCTIWLFFLLLTNGAFVSLSIEETPEEGKLRNELTPEMIKKLLDVVKDELLNGFDFEDIAYYSDDHGINLKIIVPYINLLNIGDFDIRDTSVNNDKMQIGAAVTFKVLNATGNYSLDADSKYFHFFGNGSCSAYAAGLDVNVSVTFYENEDNILRVAEAYLNYNLTEVQVWLDNLLDGCKVGKHVNELINVVLPDVIKVAKPTALTFLENFTNDKLILLGMNWDQFVDFIEEIIPPSET